MCTYTVKRQKLKKNKDMLKGGARLHRTSQIKESPA